MVGFVPRDRSLDVQQRDEMGIELIKNASQEVLGSFVERLEGNFGAKGSSMTEL